MSLGLGILLCSEANERSLPSGNTAKLYYLQSRFFFGCVCLRLRA